MRCCQINKKQQQQQHKKKRNNLGRRRPSRRRWRSGRRPTRRRPSPRSPWPPFGSGSAPRPGAGRPAGAATSHASFHESILLGFHFILLDFLWIAWPLDRSLLVWLHLFQQSLSAVDGAFLNVTGFSWIFHGFDVIYWVFYHGSGFSMAINDLISFHCFSMVFHLF